MKINLVPAVMLVLAGLLACTEVSQPEDGCSQKLEARREAATLKATAAINRTIGQLPNSSKAILEPLQEAKKAFRDIEVRSAERGLKSAERAIARLRSKDISGLAAALEARLKRVEDAFSGACL